MVAGSTFVKVVLALAVVLVPYPGSLRNAIRRRIGDTKPDTQDLLGKHCDESEECTQRRQKRLPAFSTAGRTMGAACCGGASSVKAQNGSQPPQDAQKANVQANGGAAPHENSPDDVPSNKPPVTVRSSSGFLRVSVSERRARVWQERDVYYFVRSFFSAMRSAIGEWLSCLLHLFGRIGSEAWIVVCEMHGPFES
eukprot:1898420-Rhodomonas_salina.2